MNDADMLADIRRRLPAARAALAHALGDMPAAGSGSGGGVSDRTGRLAIGVLEGRDGALTDSRRLDHVERVAIVRLRTGHSISRQLVDIIDILDRWAPTDKRRRALTTNLRAASDDMLDRADWAKCQSHRRIPGITPPETRRPGGRLCRWCEDWTRALTDPGGDWALELDMPPIEMVRANALGLKIDRHIPPARRRAR